MADAAEEDLDKDEGSDDGSNDDEHDADDADDKEASAETKPAKASTSKETRDKPAASKGERATAKKRAAAGTSGGGGKPAARPAARPSRQGAMAKSMVLFLLIVGTLGVSLWLLGRDDGGAATQAPRWVKGQKVDVEITLVHTDQQDLACASVDEMNGKHCAFEAKGKPWTKTDAKDDKATLKPYTTTDRIQFLAAGLWSDPGLTKAPLPRTRFSVKCKFTVDGNLKKPAVRWASDGPWFDQANDMYAGSVSDCTLAP